MVHDQSCRKWLGSARKTAEFLGLSVTGTLGLLVAARGKGKIKKVRSVVDYHEELSGLYNNDVATYLNPLSKVIMVT